MLTINSNDEPWRNSEECNNEEIDSNEHGDDSEENAHQEDANGLVHDDYASSRLSDADR